MILRFAVSLYTILKNIVPEMGKIRILDQRILIGKNAAPWNNQNSLLSSETNVVL